MLTIFHSVETSINLCRIPFSLVVTMPLNHCWLEMHGLFFTSLTSYSFKNEYFPFRKVGPGPLLSSTEELTLFMWTLTLLTGTYVSALNLWHWGGAVHTTCLSCGGMYWRKMFPPFTLHSSLPITDEGANPSPYQLQRSGKQALLFNLGSSVELKLLTGVQVNRPWEYEHGRSGPAWHLLYDGMGRSSHPPHSLAPVAEVTRAGELLLTFTSCNTPESGPYL